MKKLSFILLIFISIVKVGSAGNHYNDYYQHSNKANIECVQIPPKYKTVFFKHNNSNLTHLKKYSGLKDNPTSNKFSLLYFNNFITSRFIVQKYNANSNKQFIKSLQKKIFQLPADKDPFQLS